VPSRIITAEPSSLPIGHGGNDCSLIATCRIIHYYNIRNMSNIPFFPGYNKIVELPDKAFFKHNNLINK
jgi:hypothetical protein